ncbi:ABC transporter permease [Thiorhodococcus fuscus]|uniref:ABC transporter permease n=1 Tax=Thiorhodococcus fuscus TaxID=527200 RepID=A0ABW4YAK6_9GAMM
MSPFWHEALDEFRAGLRSGVVPLIYLVLVGYLLMVLTHSGYLRDMGAVDIPRNAPSLVYLMTSGDAFFLFFAWAWVFAQPIVRDRSARLNELVLTAPVPLAGWLTARFVGALGIALLLGSSQIVGFLAAPLLEWVGAVPAGSIAPAPWAALGWAWLVFTLPLALGAGALYYLAAIRSRSLIGPFIVAAGFMTFWMVAMVVLKSADASPVLATLLDPSGFAEAEHQVEHWTPHEKSTALLAPTPALLASRVLWCLLPLALLWAGIRRTTRESLILEPVQRARPSARRQPMPAMSAPTALPGPITKPSWWLALVAESGWQLWQVLSRRRVWGALGFLTVLAVVGAVYHIVQHADGPLEPRPELVAPLLTELFYLIIAFVVAGLVGITARRDDQIGLGEMLDATPAPNAVRLIGRLVTVVALTLILALVPGIGTLITTALIAPQSLDLALTLGYQVLVLAPALLELAAVTVLLHALIRHPGPAYAASVLATFVFIVNHETGLVSYPPHQIGVPVDIALSGLTGLGPWLEQILSSGAFKLALVALLLALAATLTPRGTETGWAVRWPGFRHRVAGPAGKVALLAALALIGLEIHLYQHYRIDGTYETLTQQLTKNAHWEQRWLAPAAPFAVLGGTVELSVNPAERTLRGRWTLNGVHAVGGLLHAELPDGFRLEQALVEGQETATLVEGDHLALQLADCGAPGCRIELVWSQRLLGWSAEHRPSWLLRDSVWLHATEVLPRLGLDPDRVPRVPAERVTHGLWPEVTLPAYRTSVPSGAAAPAGNWSWRVRIAGQTDAAEHEDTIDGPLDFAVIWAPRARHSLLGGFEFVHDRTRTETAATIAEDLAAMRDCVTRRLGSVPNVQGVVQWPRALGDSTLAGDRLLLAEDPHWDVADQGVGRWKRRAAIATALAQRQIRDVADLRQGPGSLWLASGVPGAIGLLCVAETDGLDALTALIARGADATTQALAGSSVPVGALRMATSDGWARDYGPLAALDWTARQTPAQFATLLTAIRRGDDLDTTLASIVGATSSARILGAPNASDVQAATQPPTGERWHWFEGEWLASRLVAEAWRYRVERNRLTLDPPSDASSPRFSGPDETAFLYLDAWPGYERAPADNLMHVVE